MYLLLVTYAGFTVFPMYNNYKWKEGVLEIEFNVLFEPQSQFDFKNCRYQMKNLSPS